MHILIVGGAGYIGSHMVKRLDQSDCQITTLDNLSGGYRDAVLYGEFVEGDIADSERLDQIFAQQPIDAVMHFASYIQVGESVVKPEIYYQNNLVNTLNLLNAMVRHGVERFIFSSTAAIFGEPDYTPIDEAHPTRPINPYGRTKLMVEQALADYQRAYGLRSVCLRYFNAAGADRDGQLGERHDPESHLIPLVLQVASGRRAEIKIFGRDYPTADGTAVRDYIHISDLCDAHWLALERLLEGTGSEHYNLGNGNGFSVQEVIDVARQVTGREIAVQESPRRDGDSATLVADATLARERLGWRPQYPDLETIINHAWRWEKSLLQ